MINRNYLTLIFAVILVSLVFYVSFWMFVNYPKELEVKRGEGSIIVKWKDVFKLGFSHYEIYRQEMEYTEIKLVAGDVRANSFVDNTCNQDKEHVYSVQAVDIFGLKSKTVLSEEIICPLRAPYNLQIRESKSSLVLVWEIDSLEDFSHYNIYRSINTSGNQDLLVDNLKIREHEDQNTENALDYYYWVKVFNKDGMESSYSVLIKGRWQIPVPPSNFKVKKIDDSVMELTWSPNPESDIAGYNVYASTGGGSSSYTGKINDELVTGLSYIDNDLNLNRDIYYYRIKAVDAAGNESGKYSQLVRIKLNPDAEFPKFDFTKQEITVTGLTVERIYENQNLVMVIRWNPVTNPQLSHYEICAPSMSDPCSDSGKVVAAYSVFTNEYLHKDFIGEAMFYYVRAVYKDGSKSNYTKFWVKRDGSSFQSAPNVGDVIDGTS